MIKRRQEHEFRVMEEAAEIGEGRGRYRNSVNIVCMYKTFKNESKMTNVFAVLTRMNIKHPFILL